MLQLPELHAKLHIQKIQLHKTLSDLFCKPLYRELVRQCGFEKAVLLRRQAEPRYQVEELGLCEDC